ncbi:LacI family DNA-binding transcriptional regulator [Lichenihabitans psoromatis]|uniref:LacI family DNA-binding transcriptional regulator n=1 Tax=Lichenihabitans psoromatis TaxID=2528642 RepID=UPI00103843A4|nr:LacI family DNA-binding transcriptional regulator [Lichenihabitans psoromatis]
MARAAGGRKATIYDIATATKASASTVSLVLNGSWARYRIKEDTAQRVLESARTLGYNVNLKARGLRLSRSGLAGMILPHYRNRFFADLAETFEAEARRRSLCPIVVSTQRDGPSEVKVTETLLAQQVEFLFIVGVAEPEPLNRLCGASDTPCVNIDLPGEAAPSVVSDNRAGARQLTDLLIGKIRARGGDPASLLYLGGVAGEYATDNRVAGFTDALGAQGIRPSGSMLMRCGYPPAAAKAALQHYLEVQGRLPVGLFISSIAVFEGLVQFAATLPPRSLEQLVVGCFDWDPFAASLPFDVSMLRQNVEVMIEEAFTALGEAEQIARPFVMVPPVLERP